MKDADRATDARPRRLAGSDDLEALLAAEELALLELYTENCGICASMEPVLGLVARSVDATVALLDLGEEPRLADRFEVTSVPTLILFREAEEVDRLADGVVPTAEVVAFVESHQQPSDPSR